MYPSVRNAFVAFTRRFEGEVPWMYLDVKGLVTVGLGNLLESPAAAMSLSWVWRQTGAPADSTQVRDEWHRVKSLQGMRMQGGGAFAHVTFLSATPESIARLVDEKLRDDELVLRKFFACYDTWPGDAQLGVLSMAWALGPYFPTRWPKFTAAAKAAAWTAAAQECRTSDEAVNPGVRPRNDANETLFLNAAEVLSRYMPPEQLYYPRDLSNDTQA